MTEITLGFFARLQEKYPELHQKATKVILPPCDKFNNNWEYFYPDLPRRIASQYMYNAFLRLPYLLFDPKYIWLLNNLSLTYGYCVFATDIIKATKSDFYLNKKWIPHGARESCIYSIINRGHSCDGYYEGMFIVYGTMKTISILVISIWVDQAGEVIRVRLDPELTAIAGGLLPTDIADRCLISFKKAITYKSDAFNMAAHRLCLVALQEPNFGHHQWNIFSSLIDVCDYFLSNNDSRADQPKEYALAYDPLTNYLALDEIGTFYGLSTVCNESYSFLKHGPLFTLDAPIPRANCTGIFERIFSISKKKQDRESIIVIIKGFNEKYNQAQMEASLAELILLNVVKDLIAEHNVDIIIDGVSRSSSIKLTLDNNEAFARFFLDEIGMYQNLLLSLSDQDRTRVTNIIGLSAKDKYSYYVNSGFSLSISAHSTLVISLMAGKPTIDIMTTNIMKSFIKNNSYYHAKNVDPHGFALICIDESDPKENILEHIRFEMRKFFKDRSSFLFENSITTHNER